jgi:RND family efflux transporter MFP subunit
MTQPRRGSYEIWLVLAGVFVAGLLAAAGYYFTRGVPAATARDVEPSESPAAAEPQVEVVFPTLGEMDRTTSQPGSVRAFESVELYAEASGYLRRFGQVPGKDGKPRDLDIGDRVTRGQVLAQVAVPDLEKQVQRDRAALAQARARVAQMKAGIESAKADLEAAKASVPQAQALARSKAATLRFREKQLQRYRDLLAGKDIDGKVVDESIEQRDAAREAKIAAEEGVNSARAKVIAMGARVAKAVADDAEAEAEVQVAQADLEQAEVKVNFATVVAPFDGVITERNYYRGDFVRNASEGKALLPVFRVQRTDLFRIVVQVPDRDVPYAHPGDPATVEIDALPGEKFPATVARVSRSEDPQTRLMHVEIDLPNTPDGRIDDGMYGQVTILLEKSKVLAVPSSCLVGKVRDGKGQVCVVRDGRAHLAPVHVSSDNGLRVGVVSGLRADDHVVLHPGSDLEEGRPVGVAEGPAENVAGH